MRTMTSPDGEALVVLPEAEYDALLDQLDAARHELAMQRYRAGHDEALTAEQALAYAQALTPLAFWRKHRGVTQQALADLVGISQSYVADLEAGRRQGSPSLLLRIAKALRTSVESLIEP